MVREAEEFRRAEPNNAKIGSAVAEVYRKAGNIFRLNEEYDKAIHHEEIALKYLDDLRKHDRRNANYVIQSAMILSDKGETLGMAGRLDEALISHAKAQSLLGELSDQQRGQDGARIAEALLHTNLGSLHQETGNYLEALESFNRSLACQDLLRRPGPSSWRLYAVALLGRADCLKGTGSIDEAEKSYTNAIGKLAEQESPRATAPDAVYLRALGFTQRGLLLAGARRGDPLADFEAALTRLTTLCRDHPGLVPYAIGRAAALEGRGKLRLALRNLNSRNDEDARVDLEEARAILEGLRDGSNGSPPTRAVVLRQLGSILSGLADIARARGEPGRARTLLGQAIEIQGKVEANSKNPEDRELLKSYRDARDKLPPAIEAGP
jgi:tetratricopeptide (TPR) repeat protein